MNDTPAPPSAAIPAAASPQLLVPVALLALYLIWGSTYLAIRVALTGFAPFALAAIRFAIAGGGLYVWLRLRGVAAPTRRQWRNAAVTGVLLLLGGNALVCFAEQQVASGIAAVAVAAMPLYAAIFAGLYGEWPSRTEVLGLLIGFVGVVLLNLGGSLSGSTFAALALLAAPALWAFGSVWSRRQDMPSGPMNTATQMLTAVPALALTAFASGEHLPQHPGLRATAALLYLAVFGSLIAFSAYLFLLRTVRPALATSYAYVNPPVAVLFGVLLGGERVGPLDLAGMAVILAGVVIVILTRQRRR